MSDNERKLTRRLFLQHSAVATAVSATFYSVAMKTDAIAQTGGGGGGPSPGTDPVLPYQYATP